MYAGVSMLFDHIPEGDFTCLSCIITSDAFHSQINDIRWTFVSGRCSLQLCATFAIVHFVRTVLHNGAHLHFVTLV